MAREKVQVTVNVDKALYRRAEAIAAETGINSTTIINMALMWFNNTYHSAVVDNELVTLGRNVIEFKKWVNK